MYLGVICTLQIQKGNFAEIVYMLQHINDWVVDE